MRKLLIIILFFVSLSHFADSSNNKAVVIVNISNFANNKGQVFSHLYNKESAEYFPTKSRLAFMKKRTTANNLKAQIVFDDVPYGLYALTSHHDENSNGKLDRSFIGYPAEGFGLSNNPKLLLSIPSFDECSFEVNSDTVIVNIILKFV